MRKLMVIRIGSALLGLMLFPPTVARAHTVLSRSTCGVVERLDMTNRSVRFSPKHAKAPTYLALTSQTKFVHNWRFAPASELNDGTRAVVYYRSPLLGKPFVTKMIWVNGGK